MDSMLTGKVVGQGFTPETAEWLSRSLLHPSIPSTDGNGHSGTLLDASGGILGGNLNNKQSPLGIELGEFMLDSDLDFLSSQLFEYNPGGGAIG